MNDRQPIQYNKRLTMVCMAITFKFSFFPNSSLSLCGMCFKVTRHVCFKNSKNLQLLDIQACNLAKGQNVLRSQIFAIFEA